MFALDAFSEISFSGTPITFTSVATTAVSASTSVNFGSLLRQLTQTSTTGTTSAGTMGALTSSPESGQIATGNIGLLIPQISITPSAKTGTGSLGSIAFSYTANLTGCTGTVTAGSLIPQLAPTLSKVSATGSVGSVGGVFYWTQVNDTQSPGWTTTPT